MQAAIAGGADYVGLVFYPPSPRSVTPEQAGELAAFVPDGVIKTGLVVDADDRLLDSILSATPLDLLQLHGKETPDRVREIRARTGLPVMKAVTVATAADVARATDYLDAANRLLFDAKAPASLKNALPGGNALTFDWTLLAGRDWPLPWMLSGGLDARNVAQAVAITGARAVDVSSGVETSPGVKDPERIGEFLRTVKHLT
jgi:phosphoribosylanthranilate isomerase